MSTTTAPTRVRRPRVRRRLLTVVSAIVAATLLAAFIEGVLDHDVLSPAMGGGPPIDIGAGQVAFVSALAGLAGWGSATLVARWVKRPRSTWTIVATLALLLSLTGPFSGPAASPTDPWILASFHLIVGGIIIVGIRDGIPERSER